MSKPATTVGQEKAGVPSQLQDLLQDIVREERELNETRFAARLHAHPEFKRLEKAVADLVIKLQPPDLSLYALKNHTHPVKITPLANVELGEKIREITQMQFCPVNHQHPELESRVTGLQKDVEELGTRLTGYVSAEDFAQLLAGVEVFRKEVLQQLEVIKKSIPKLPVDEPEIMAAKVCIIPKRCEGRRIVSILVADVEGNATQRPLRFGNEEVKLGDAFKLGDLLTIPPNCIALIRFQ